LPDGRVLYLLWNKESQQAIELEPQELLDLMAYARENKELIRSDARVNDRLEQRKRIELH